MLTVDDDADYLELLGERLKKRGYEVMLARSGEEALAVLEAQPVDCILLDRSMAGIGGVATCKRIKNAPATRDTPLIFLTATEQRDAVIEGLGAGADDFVSKASGFDVLSARVQAQLRRRQIEDEQRKVREQLLRSELDVSEARAARELAEARATMAEELARANGELASANRELETFSYSVSHDLRAPLRTIGAFTQALAEELGDRATDRERDHIRRVLAASSRMADLIEALLELSRISRAPIGRHRVDLSAMATTILEEHARHDVTRTVLTQIAPDLVVAADGRPDGSSSTTCSATPGSSPGASTQGGSRSAPRGTCSSSRTTASASTWPGPTGCSRRSAGCTRTRRSRAPASGWRRRGGSSSGTAGGSGPRPPSGAGRSSRSPSPTGRRLRPTPRRPPRRPDERPRACELAGVRAAQARRGRIRATRSRSAADQSGGAEYGNACETFG